MDISDIVPGNTIQTEKTDFGSTYSEQQQKINRRYKAESNDRYVLFVTSKTASGGQHGYFRLNGQFGYIFGNAKDKTPAHEVGHGVFKLEHPWSAYGTKEGKTNLLMDKNSGEIISHLEWKQINDPKLKLYAFQKQKEGELAGGFGLSPDWKFVKTDTNLVSWGATNIKDGFIPGFKTKDKTYYEWNGTHYVDVKGNRYTTIETNSIKDSSRVIWLFYNNSKHCTQHSYIKTTLGKVANIIENKNENALVDFINKHKDITDTTKETYSVTLGCGHQKTENNDSSEKRIVNYSSREINIDALLKQINITHSKTGIKGRIFITDKNTSQQRIAEVQNEIEELKKSNNKEIYIWAKDFVDEKHFTLEIAIGKGFGNKQNEIQKLIDLTHRLTKDKGLQWAGDFNPITAIFDGLAELIGRAKIPEKFYNPEANGYNPFPSEIYGYVSGTKINDLLLSNYNPKYTKTQLEFAYVCGLWNGSINVVGSLPEGASFVVKMITNEENTRDNTFNAISKLSFDSITQMAEQEWEKFKNLNACLQAEKAGELTIETVTIVASFTKLGKVSKVVSALDDLDAFSQVAKLSGKLIKPVVKAGSKSVKFVLNEGVNFISRAQVRVKGLGCLFPYIEIRLKDKINAIDDLTLQKKVSASIEEKGGLDKLPTDENGNKIVEIELNGEKTPVVIGSNEGLEKIGKVSTSNWLKSFKTKINPRKDFPDGKFEKYVTGDDIQYEIKGGNEKIWADGIKINENKVVDAKHNPGNFYTMKNYETKPFLYQDLESEFKRYSAIINDTTTPVNELIIYISKNNDDSIKLFEYLGNKYNVKTKVILKEWSE